MADDPKRIRRAAENDDELQLPEAIIQHIQSFLMNINSKDVVRSAILSKLWYKAWSTQPNLYLSDIHFHEIRTNGFSRVFQDFARKTMNRYKTLNLKLDSFRLQMLMTPNDSESPRLADELILDALRLGVNDLFVGVYGMYVLPDQVSASIISSRILSLELLGVAIGDGMMRDVLSGCPLIEKLNLRGCVGLNKVELSVVRRALKYFIARDTLKPVADSLSVEFGEYGDGSLVYSNLISLELNNVKITDLSDGNFPHRFPSLGKMTLQNCGLLRKYTDTIISCTKFDGRISDINLHVSSWTLQASWFVGIRNFLQCLSLSGISLIIDATKVWFTENDIRSDISTLPVVENLTIKTAMGMRHCSSFFYGLFWSCRPKYFSPIDLRLENTSYKQTLEHVYEELKKQVNKNCLEAFEALNCIHGLKEVTLEIYEESPRVWRPAPHEALRGVRDGEQVQFRLKWS